MRGCRAVAPRLQEPSPLQGTGAPRCLFIPVAFLANHQLDAGAEAEAEAEAEAVTNQTRYEISLQLFSYLRAICCMVYA